MWKISLFIHGFPLPVRPPNLSTGYVGRFLLKLWKTSGKMFKTVGTLMVDYLLELMFVIIAFTVPEKLESVFIFFSTFPTELYTVE